ncbi:septal ring factor EnvC (AmiA/AmiB activator) [Pseudomonas sp. TE6283]
MRRAPPQSGAKPRTLLRFAATFGAGLVAALPLLNLLGVGAEKLVGLGKIQSTVELQATLIKDLQAEKKILSEKTDQLKTHSHELELKVIKSEADLTLANLQLAQANRMLDDYKALNTQLDRRAKSSDPCLSIQRVIADFEKQLAVDPPWSHALRGPRRDETIAQLQAHQQSLRTCLSHNVQPTG